MSETNDRLFEEWESEGGFVLDDEDEPDSGTKVPSKPKRPDKDGGAEAIPEREFELVGA